MEYSEPEYYVYTDGACIHNGSENASAGIGIYFAEGDPRNVSKKIGGKQTNNTAELTAILETFSIIEEDLRMGKWVTIVTDSNYALLCLSSYGDKCAKKQWTQDIPNKELVKQTYETYKNAPTVRFMYVKAHTQGEDAHSIGNRHADALASQGAADNPDPTVKRIFMNVNKKSGPGQKQGTEDRIYLNVPYAQKEIAKKGGAKWDIHEKKWYIYEDNKWKVDLLDEFS